MSGVPSSSGFSLPEAARRGYLHLREHNLAYLDDGVENIIDDYCALLAAIELTRTLGDLQRKLDGLFDATAR